MRGDNLSLLLFTAAFAADRDFELLTVTCCLRFVAMLVVCFIATRESFEGEWHRSK